MNSNINLLGTKNTTNPLPPASQKLKLLRLIAILLLFVVSSAAITLYILISFSPLPQVQQQEQEALQRLSQSHPEMTKIAYVKDRIESIKTLLKVRTSYDVVLTNIMTQMPSGTTIDRISLNNKTITLTLKSNSLDSLNSFVESLTESAKNSKQYSQVTLDSIVSTDESNDFLLTFTLILI